MSNKYLDILTQIVRHPRHVVRGADHVSIAIERARQPTDGGAAPEIIDFSRGGCRMVGSDQLRQNEPIVLRITDNTNGLSLELPATVRWSRDGVAGTFEAGCQFDQELDYEHLGELFLAGFLSSEELSTE